MVKKVAHHCNRCKQYRIKKLKAPATGVLPEFRANLTSPFAATEMDFAGSMLYKVLQPNSKGKYYPVPGKCYIALYTCATTRAVQLKLCRDATAHEFQLALKEFVARRDKPLMFISDNTRTFQATKRWLDLIQEDQDALNYIDEEKIVTCRMKYLQRTRHQLRKH